MAYSQTSVLRDRGAACAYSLLLVGATLWCASIVLAPLLLHGTGISLGLSGFLYDTLNRVCHQREDHSFHLLGEKLGVCIRCSSVYFSFLLTLVAFPLLHRVPELRHPPRGWLIASAFPMVIDVLLSVAGLHESSTLTRVLSGMIFGTASVFFIAPPALEIGRSFFLRHFVSSTIIPTE